MGLGVVWISIYLAEDRMKTTTDLLKLPEHIILFCANFAWLSVSGKSTKKQMESDKCALEQMVNKCTK